MNQAVGNELPHKAVMYHRVRQEFELVEDELIDTAQASHSEQFHQQEHARVDSNQPRHRPSERRQAQRHWFPSSSHRLTSHQFYSFRSAPLPADFARGGNLIDTTVPALAPRPDSDVPPHPPPAPLKLRYLSKASVWPASPRRSSARAPTP